MCFCLFLFLFVFLFVKIRAGLLMTVMGMFRRDWRPSKSNTWLDQHGCRSATGKQEHQSVVWLCTHAWTSGQARDNTMNAGAWTDTPRFETDEHMRAEQDQKRDCPLSWTTWSGQCQSRDRWDGSGWTDTERWRFAEDTTETSFWYSHRSVRDASMWHVSWSQRGTQMNHNDQT